ncbi:acyl-CoA dehydratase activase [Chloroflexota bacterium]
MALFMGVDIGSDMSKGVITRESELLAFHVISSGVDYRSTAQKLREELLAKAKLSAADIAYTVATGQGSAFVPFSNEVIDDIRCSARGINSFYPSVRTVIDVGDQSSRVIRVNSEGQITNFVMNERCATGSGQFLKIIAHVLRVDLNDIGHLSSLAQNPVTLTTGCAVFGESEVVSRLSEGVSKEDILAGVHKSLAKKISALIDNVVLEHDCAISGGGGLDAGLVKSVEEELGIHLQVPRYPQVVTALGAAIMAKELVTRAKGELR